MEKATTLYVFRHEDAEFCYDSDNLRLMKGSTRISLEHKPREVLAHLLKNPQKLIRYQELKTAVWGKTHVEDASVHNAVSKVNVALKRAQPGADFIRTVPGVGVEILVDVDPAATTSPSITAETGVNDSTEPRASEEPDPHESLNAISPTLHFKIDWRDPPYTSLTLHVDQPLFEGFPGDWFYGGRTANCPPFFRVLLSCPGVTSVMRSSPYEVQMGRAELARLDAAADYIANALKGVPGVFEVQSGPPAPSTSQVNGPDSTPVLGLYRENVNKLGQLIHALENFHSNPEGVFYIGQTLVECESFLEDSGALEGARQIIEELVHEIDDDERRSLGASFEPVVSVGKVRHLVKYLKKLKRDAYEVARVNQAPNR
jgi:DNA-binding winged helix-turn-helix (wHTH) protein